MPKRRRASEKKTVVIEINDDSDSDSHGKQLKRRNRCSNTESRQQGKLGSASFDCYLKDIWANLKEDQRASSIYLDCVWFHLYRKESFKEKVLNWIKKIDIFSKKYVFVPILCWRHWSLLVFCQFGEISKLKSRKPCMLLLDSMQMPDHMRQLEPTIRKFVLDIFSAKDRPEKKEQIFEIPLLMPKVPQQRGGTECGYYVLYFIKSFVDRARKNFNVLKGYPHFMKEDWFGHEEFDSFYLELTS